MHSHLDHVHADHRVHAHVHGREERGEGGHELSHAPRQLAGRRKERGRLLATLGLALGIMAAEAVGGWLTHSLALISDAGHMFTDAGAILLSLLALWFGARPANARKTYGYYRIEILAGLINGLALIAVSLGIGYEAWRRLANPPAVHVVPMMLVALLGTAANGLGVLLLSSSKSLNARGVLLHIVGDLAASVGVFVAGVVMWRTHWWIADPLISLGISAIILAGAYGLVKEAVDVLLEATPAHLDAEKIVEAMHGVAEVVAVHDLHVWTISSGMYALSAHVVVEQKSCSESDEILRQIKTVVRERFHIDHTTLQIESEVYEHLGEVSPVPDP